MRLFARHVFILAAAGLATGCGKPQAKDEQAFGVHMGDALASLAAVRPLEEPPLFNYSFKPKEMLPPFSDYAVLATPGAGVCAVRARAVDTVPDTRALLDSLRKKYGAGSSNQALHSYYWYPDVNVPPTSPVIDTVALSDLGTTVSLTYTFKNMPACRKDLGLDDVQAQTPPE
jgi:hypothetical protein